MFIKPSGSPKSAWTLVEMMVAVALFSIASTAMSTLFLYSIKSFASMANYAMLDRENREAMDRLTRELRQAKYVAAYTSNSIGNSLTFHSGNGTDVTYAFQQGQRRMVRVENGVSQVVLTNCNLLEFGLFQRNPSSNSYGLLPVASANWTQSVKVVQLTWKTSRTVINGPVNSENVQTARVVIRKQQDD
jgi:prepilin-type N-terminal cleavage/methylation domain-containing protein